MSVALRARELFRDGRAKIALNVLAVVGIWLAASAYQTRRHVAARAPDFTLTDLSGRRVALHDFRNRKVVLHFFATWFGVCKAELPSVRKVQAGLGKDEVLLAIAQDADDPVALRRFAADHELRYPILLGTPEVLAAYGVDRFPTNYYLNADGSVNSSTVGLSTLVGMRFRLWKAAAR